MLVVDKPPSDPAGVQFAESLRALERTGQGWEALFASLEPVCHRIARRFRYLVPLDEIKAAMMTLVYERCVGEFLNRMDAGELRLRFDLLVFDRVCARLRNDYRTEKRRADVHTTLVGSAPPDGEDRDLPHEGSEGGLASGEPLIAPDGRLRCREYLASLLDHPEAEVQDEAILELLACGHTQREVARLLGPSEPTISRRVAKIRAIMKTLADQERSS
jgi:hypothetical protein